MNDSPYLTLAATVDHEIAAIKGSRFIAFASPTSDDKSAQQFFSDIASRYPDANHHCWAYQLRDQQKTRFSDDGEPNGSAGKPILAPIVGRQLLDASIIVVRYFGGVKLGVGGLVRAYSQATNAVLDEAESKKLILRVTPKISINLRYNYDVTSQIATALATLQLTENNIRYSDCVDSELLITKDSKTHVTQILTDYTSGKIQITLNEENQKKEPVSCKSY